MSAEQDQPGSQPTPDSSRVTSNGKAQQNSLVRKLTEDPRLAVAKGLHRLGVTANQASIASAVGTTALSWYAPRVESRGGKFLLGLGIGAFKALDGVDGKISDLQNAEMAALKAEGTIVEVTPPETTEEPQELTFWENGDLVDSTLDRLGEAGAASLRVWRAARKGNKVGLALALVAAITNPITAYTRSEAEKKNRVVNESGALAGVGSSFGRGVANTFATVYESTQPFLDGLTIVANGLTAGNRWKTAHADVFTGDLLCESKDPKVVKAATNQAALRQETLGRVAKGIIFSETGVAVATVLWQRHQDKKALKQAA